MAEPELCRSALVAVRRAQHYLHAQMLQALPGLLALVVRGAVEKEDRLLTPTDAVGRGQNGSQLRQIELHYVLIGIALSLRQPHFALGRHGYNQVHPMTERLVYA